MFTEQDDFEKVIEKYDLWNDQVFEENLPAESNQEEQYDICLNECPPPDFQMPEGWYASYSEALQKNDPIMYRCGLADFTDTMRETYFEGPDERFFEPEEIKDTINEALDDRIELIEEDKL